MHQAGAELEEDQNRHQAGDELSNGNRHQAGDELRGGKILHQADAKLDANQNRHQAGDDLRGGEILHQADAELEEDQNRHQAGDELSNGNRHQAGDDLKDGEILHQAGTKLEEDQNRHQAGDELRSGEILQQPVAKLEDSQNRQQLVDEFKILFSIPWRHHVEIFTHAQSVEEARFYILKTLENGWSRNVLANMMEADLYHTQGTAITNFAEKLPAPESDLAQQTLKDPYCFDFIALRKRYTERELEDALMENITRFLLELGNGFSFIGRQYRLEVGGEEFFIDLLFYHLNLRRYVVVELKAGEFKPTDAGQLGFYVKAVNEQLKHPGDNDAIGLIICRQKNRLVAEYALKSSTQLLGISEYRLTKLLPRNFKSSLPSIQDIESQFTADEAQVGSKAPQVEPHAIDVTDHRTSKPTSNHTSKPTSNVQVEAQIHSKDPQGDSTIRPHVGSTTRPQVDSSSRPHVVLTTRPQVDSSTGPHVGSSSRPHVSSSTGLQVDSTSRPQVSKLIVRLLHIIENEEKGQREILLALGIKDSKGLKRHYISPALELGLIEMTQPDSPRSPTQKYRLTVKGKALARELKREEGKK